MKREMTKNQWLSVGDMLCPEDFECDIIQRLVELGDDADRD